MALDIGKVKKRLEEVFRRSEKILKNISSVKKSSTNEIDIAGDLLDGGNGVGIYPELQDANYVGVDFDTLCWLMRLNMVVEKVNAAYYDEIRGFYSTRDAAKKDAFEGLCEQLALGPAHIIEAFKRNPKLAMGITEMGTGMRWGEEMRENLAEDFENAMDMIATYLPRRVKSELVKNLDSELRVWAVGILERCKTGGCKPFMECLNDGILDLGDAIEEVRDEVWFEEG